MPPEVRAVGAAHQPSPGALHQLGHGAYAWRSGDEICWATTYAAGCFPRIDQPILWVTKDPDLEGAGAPAIVFGVAVDGVRGVTVTLRNGQTVSGAPANNFFVIQLPGSARPEDVETIQATLDDRSIFSQSASN